MCCKPYVVWLVWSLTKVWQTIIVYGMKIIQNVQADLLESLNGMPSLGIKMHRVFKESQFNIIKVIIWKTKAHTHLVWFRCKELQLIDRCHQIEPRMGTLEEILLKHTQRQVDILKSTENETDKEKLEELSSHYEAIYFHPVSCIPTILPSILIYCVQ